MKKLIVICLCVLLLGIAAPKARACNPEAYLRRQVADIALVAMTKLEQTRKLSHKDAIMTVEGIAPSLWALTGTQGAGNFESTRQAVLDGITVLQTDILAEQIGDALAVAVTAAVLNGVTEEQANYITAEILSTYKGNKY